MSAPTKKVLLVALLLLVVGIAFIYGMVNVATDSIQFDLTKIGESIYEAHTKTGKWPVEVSDLDGTMYLSLPYRRKLLEDKHYVVVWRYDHAASPAANRDRILAYDNGSLLARLGRIWVCRGDLSLERLSSEELSANLALGKP